MRRLLLFALGLYAFAAVPAGASERLTGIVLMVPSATTIVVHHEAFAGMPSMSMTFAVPRGTAVRPGEHITADVDRATEPWRLTALHVTAGATVPHPAIPRFLNAGDRVPSVAFVDQRGRRLTLAALRGQPYALTFVYTRCRDPKMCPLVSAKLRQVQTLIAGSRAALVEVSLDPAYDRPAILARYGMTFDADPARWHVLTGDPRAVLDFAARFRILERSAGPDTIVHTERLAIVDRTGRIARFFDNAAWRPVDVADQLKL
jgi:protein SCO1/2